MILSVGEITQDIYLNDENGTFEIKVGGAPFNLAVALKKLGAKVGFYSCVGGDGFGRKVSEKISDYKLDFLKLDCRKDANTPTVFIRNRGDEVEFTPFCKMTSDKYLKYESIKEAAKMCDIIHFGSLMFAESRGRKFAYETMEEAEKHGCKMSFDANLRDGVFSSVKEARKIYRDLFSRVDFVKFSQAEILTLFDTDDMDTAVREMSRYKKTFFVTLGRNGSLWCRNNTVKKIDAISVDSVDPTGAGDAFFAGVLSQLSERRDLSESDIDRAARYGNICGALTTLKKGTCEASPTKEQAEKYLK